MNVQKSKQHAHAHAHAHQGRMAQSGLHQEGGSQHTLPLVAHQTQWRLPFASQAPPFASARNPKTSTNKQAKKKKKTPKPCALVHACVLCAYVCRVCMRVCFRQPAGRLGTCVEASKSRTSSSSLASSLSSQNVIRWIHTLTNVRFSQTLQTNRSCASIHHSFSSIESKPKAQS